MKKYLRALIVLVGLSIWSEAALPQEGLPVQIGADVMSRYIWRGINLGGSSPSIQPWIKYTISTKGSAHALTIGAWGAYTFSNTSNQEVDLSLIYTYQKIISLSVTDYFFPEMYAGTGRNRYFNYSQDSTCHVFEGTVSFNGTEKIPVTVLFSMNLYGNDARKINSDGSLGKIFMTKYMELGYKKNVSGVDLNAFVGATLDKPDQHRGETGFYGNQTSGIINLGVKAAKAIPITATYSIPVQFSLITNPEAERIFLVFGFSF